MYKLYAIFIIHSQSVNHAGFNSEQKITAWIIAHPILCKSVRIHEHEYALPCTMDAKMYILVYI